MVLPFNGPRGVPGLRGFHRYKLCAQLCLGKEAKAMLDNLSALIRPGDVVYNRDLVTSRFGEDHWHEVIKRGTDTSIYTPHELSIMWDDLIAYYLARACMDDPNDDLIACLAPDFMQHTWLLYTKEIREFFLDIAGVFLDHDPASESALVNNPAATAKTVGLFERHHILYHPRLWQDHLHFPFGARVIPAGIVAVSGVPQQRATTDPASWV
jgi:hypothetical protein